MSRDLPSDSGGFGQGQGCLPGRGAKVGRENGTQNRMALLRVEEAGLWDTGPAVHHRGGANGTRARELQENRRWTMAVPGSSRRFPGSLGKPALSPLSRRARGLRGPAPLAFASGVWLHFNFPRVTCAMLPSLPRALWPPSPGPLSLWVGPGPGSLLADFGRPFGVFRTGVGAGRCCWYCPVAILMLYVELGFCYNRSRECLF